MMLRLVVCNPAVALSKWHVPQDTVWQYQEMPSPTYDMPGCGTPAAHSQGQLLVHGSKCQWCLPAQAVVPNLDPLTMVLSHYSNLLASVHSQTAAQWKHSVARAVSLNMLKLHQNCYIC